MRRRGRRGPRGRATFTAVILTLGLVATAAPVAADPPAAPELPTDGTDPCPPSWSGPEVRSRGVVLADLVPPAGWVAPSTVDGDVDGDGTLDRLDVDPASRSATLRWSSGSVTLVDLPTDAGSGPGPVGLADLTGDGRAELVVAGLDGLTLLRPGLLVGDHTVAWSEADTLAGARASSAAAPEGASGAGLVPLWDLDGDGAAEVAAVWRFGRAQGTADVHGAAPCPRLGTQHPEVLDEQPAAPPAISTEPAVTPGRPPVLRDDAPDPHLLRVGATYYLYSTNVITGFGWRYLPVWSSRDLENWTLVGDAMRDSQGRPTFGAWAQGDGYVWAPTVVRTGSTYVALYTARHGSSGRQCIGRATSSSPTGPFVDRAAGPFMCQVSLGGSIDPSVIVDDRGTPWMLWKSDGNCCGIQTALWSVPLDRELRGAIGPARILLLQDRTWELPLVEQPAMERGAGKTLLFYSGGWWNSNGYATGYARCNGPAGGCVKQTVHGPWHASTTWAAGPGGASFVGDPAGGRWMAYHGWVDAVGYDFWGRRGLFVERVDLRGSAPTFHPSVPYAAARVPVGAVDWARPGPRRVRMGGWAADPDTPDPITIHIYAAGRGAKIQEAKGPRDDVAAAFPELGRHHGFDLTAPADPGTQQVCAYGIDVGGYQNQKLRCTTVTVPTGPPLGSLDQVWASAPGEVRVHGWALDPDSAASLSIHVYVDGQGAAAGTTTHDRHDVGALFPEWGARRGFDLAVPAAPGRHDVCAYAIDAVAPGPNVKLGCRVVEVP